MYDLRRDPLILHLFLYSALLRFILVRGHSVRVCRNSGLHGLRDAERRYIDHQPPFAKIVHLEKSLGGRPTGVGGAVLRRSEFRRLKIVFYSAELFAAPHGASLIRRGKRQ